MTPHQTELLRARQARYRERHLDERRAAGRANSRAYRAAHRDQELTRAAQFRAEHREEIAAWHRAYRAEHPEKMREYRQLHREAIQAKAAEYLASHKSEAAYRNARARFGEAPSFEVWNEVWNGACFNCGLTPAGGVDHVLARDHGGRNVATNLQPACFPCNARKWWYRNGDPPHKATPVDESARPACGECGTLVHWIIGPTRSYWRHMARTR